MKNHNAEKNEVKKLKYHYHVMNKRKILLFRYDNVPHFPRIKTHPHHKHVGNTVRNSNVSGLIEVVDEVERLIIKDKTLS